MKDVTDLVEDIILDIDCSIKVESIVKRSDSIYDIYTCNTKWARKGKTIFIYEGTTGYGVVIKNVVENSYIVVEINFAEPTFERVELTKPFYISGTKISTNNEWSKAGNNLLVKTPLIWLYQNYTDKVFGLGSSLERNMNLNIAFLDETNPKFETNKEHINNAVKPCNALKEEFVKSINKKAIYKTLIDYSTKTFSRFGVESDSGVIQNILDANLGGVVLNITLDKFKEPCKC